MISILYGPTLISVHDYWKNHSLDYMELCWQFFNIDFDSNNASKEVETRVWGPMRKELRKGPYKPDQEQE